MPARKSACPLDCPDTCSWIVTVKQGEAIALRGDRACGVDNNRNYIWRPSPGSPEVRASPR